MPRQLFLHIGTTKTGSTSIQHALAGARKYLPEQGAFLPETHGDVRHTRLAASFALAKGTSNANNPVWHGRDPSEVIAEYLVTFKEEMLSLPPEITRVILSSEHFSHWIRNADDIKRLHALLAGCFDDIKVVVYLRRQDAHYASLHSELIRLGRLDAPDMGNPSAFWHDYDYVELVGRWAAVFGEKAMCPRIFERAPGAKFDVVDDFFMLCGLVKPPAVEALQERNVSMNLTGQRIIREIEGFLRDNPKMGDLLHNRPSWQRVTRAVTKALPGAGWLPTQAEAASFMENYAKSNEQLRQRWFPERVSLFSDDFSKLPQTAPEIDPTADFTAACGVIVELALDAMRQQQRHLRAESSRAAKANETTQQRAVLLRAVKLNASDVNARMSLVRLQIKDGSFESARQNLEAVLKSNPNHKAAAKLLKRVDRMSEPQQKKGQAKGKKRSKPVIDGDDSIAPALVMNSV